MSSPITGTVTETQKTSQVRRLEYEWSSLARPMLRAIQGKTKSLKVSMGIWNTLRGQHLDKGFPNLGSTLQFAQVGWIKNNNTLVDSLQNHLSEWKGIVSLFTRESVQAASGRPIELGESLVPWLAGFRAAGGRCFLLGPNFRWHRVAPIRLGGRMRVVFE